MCAGTLERAVHRLSGAHGPQYWWPADSPFEMAVGAVLVQNASWRNAELALDNLRTATGFDAAVVARASLANLETYLRPSGTFRIKARRVMALASWWCREFDSATALPTEDLRAALLDLHGIGPETADCIVLYAFSRPAFIADAYARRWLYRMGLTDQDASYDTVQRFGQEHLPQDVSLLQEAHALIVRHNQSHCLVRQPSCAGCTLQRNCARAGLTT